MIVMNDAFAGLIRKMNRDVKILQQIERYLNGELHREEIDALWLEFMRNKDYYDYLVTVINLRQIIREK
ncbi:MAG TPA: hypothetical protein VKA34_12795 [Balneolales bacterium]|nr:hypothetical protein [Balneolales bacterium]